MRQLNSLIEIELHQYTDTLVLTLKPFFEEKLSKKLMEDGVRLILFKLYPQGYFNLKDYL
ncbi:hypothetical protein GM3708_3475 [Geminocystis sp. NIES-3708]|uniref:hypothetical protein n=1 Tax=Geminocystis sp. NIES-3708 TaxID=1615909 RepID=UPI0005FC63D3|nr:hypothetical protein [Geminocystis sp. NIES-3708]BAQ63069.1 hypothetical protein GM3708_3475 [Geminocystis sp. NIES-3708]